MLNPSGASFKALTITVVASNAIVAAVVVTMGLRVERSIEGMAAITRTPPSAELAARAPARQASASASASSTPISSEQFRVQWEAHYAAIAEAKCWQPHFNNYLKLPGHLDLELEVSPDGGAERFELIGYKNVDDTPDPALAKAVFECVSILLRSARFPATGSPYSVRGRVTRPNPPPGFGAGAPSATASPSPR